MAPEPSVPTGRRLDGLEGHDDAERLLARAAASGRMPHAWIFGGPEGIGKASMALRFARHLLAQAPRGAASDRLDVPADHPAALRIAAGAHPDFLVVERTVDEKRGRKPTELPVEAIRRVEPFLRLTPAEGGWRVVVVDEAERLNRNSANALLKILEEPPDRAVLILVSANPGAFLPTIRSRCRRLTFAPLEDATLERVLDGLGVGADAEERRSLARLADGSPGRAVALAEAGGVALYRDIVGLLEPWPRLDLDRLHKFADRFAPVSAEEGCRLVVELIRRWATQLVRNAVAGEDGHEAIAGEAAVSRRMRAGAALDRWVEVWEKTDRLARRGDRANLDRKQTILDLMLVFRDAAA